MATQSDLSVRVIAKAEAGGPISKRTAEKLASTFREAGALVTVADLLANPATLARQFLANYVQYQGDCVQHSLDILSPDIVAYVEGDPATNPIAGEYRGLDEFDRFFKTFFGIFVRDGGMLDDPPMIANRNDVIVWGREYVRIPEAPPQKGGFVMLRMRFERGKMVRFDDHYEVSGMMLTLKKWAHEYPNGAWLQLVEQEALQAWTNNAETGDDA